MGMEIVCSNQAIVGWRVWNLVRPQWLTDISCRAVYPPRERWVASCEKWEESSKSLCVVSPGDNCTCGIYATKHDWQVDSWKIMGEIYLWGKVIEHKEGYRAQYAYVKRLIISPKEYQHLAGWLSHLYGVPAEIPTEEWLQGLQSQRRGNYTNYYGHRKYVSQADLWKIVTSREEPIQERRNARNKLRGRVMISLKGAKRALQRYRGKVAQSREKIAQLREKIEQLEELKRRFRNL